MRKLQKVAVVATALGTIGLLGGGAALAYGAPSAAPGVMIDGMGKGHGSGGSSGGSSSGGGGHGSSGGGNSCTNAQLVGVLTQTIC
jgi:hypothetical protein